MASLKEKISSYFKGRSVDNIYRLDGAVPLSKAIPFGLQHVLAMFVANISPLLIVFAALGESASEEAIRYGMMAAILFAGVGTIIQLFPIGGRVGAKLPIVVGLSFTFVGILISVGIAYGMETMFVSTIVGGLFIGILGLFAKYWRRFIKPIVAACVVLGIGLSLLAVGMESFINYEGVVDNGVYDFSVGWMHIVIALITLLTYILWQIFVPGVYKNLSIIVALVVGYLAALCFPGVIDFTSLSFTSVTDFIDVPRPVFTYLSFDWSNFNIGAILVVCLIYLVAATEGIGDISSMCQAGLGREPTDREISGGLSCDGFTSAVAGCFGALPLTTFSQNVGIVAQTKVVNRFTILMGAIFLIIASFLPIIPNFLMTIPNAVLGGCLICLFASIVVVGMQMLAKCGFTKKNVLLASLTIGIGYGITLISEFTATSEDYPDAVNYLLLILQNPVANMFILSLLLSYVLPERMNNDDRPKKTSEEVIEEPKTET